MEAEVIVERAIVESDTESDLAAAGAAAAAAMVNGGKRERPPSAASSGSENQAGPLPSLQMPSHHSLITRDIDNCL